MAFDLQSITTGAISRPPRIILTGLPKIGKSSFACGSRIDKATGMPIEFGLNFPVVIPIKNEEGVDGIPVPKFPVVTQYSELLEALRTLYKDDHTFQTLVIDSISTLEPLVWDEMCKDYGVQSVELVEKGYGKGYTIALGYWDRILYGLDCLRTYRNMRIILISHVTIKNISDPTLAASYDAYQMSVNQKLAEKLTRWADLTMFAKSDVFVSTEKKGFNKEEKRAISGGGRKLYCRANPAYPSGGRDALGWMPDGIPLDWASFEEAYNRLTGAAPAVEEQVETQPETPEAAPKKSTRKTTKGN